MAYDVIVVGARIAGAATGMLLARKGLRVLVADRASFPSDTLSSHQLQPPGAQLLAQWGLLDRLHEAETPAVRRVRFDNDGVILDGEFPDGGTLYSPRRTLLDTVLVDAARAAGAEVHERTIVDELVTSEGRVTGIRCHEKGKSEVTEFAPLVVGADGKHSLVAKTVRARAYRRREARSLGFYTYWQDLALDGGELYSWDRRLVGAWPTNDGLTVTYVGWPASEFETFRADALAGVLATLDRAGTLGERARAATHVGPLRGTTDLPNVMRRPFGPGWALAGDAGLVMDSITGQGIGHAMRDADLLSDAIVSGLGAAGLDAAGPRGLPKALARYAKARDAQTKAMFDLTVRLASFAPPSAADHLLFSAVAERPDQTAQFLGVIAGSVPMRTFFSARNLSALVGVRGLGKLARSQMRAVAPRPAPQSERAASTAQ